MEKLHKLDLHHATATMGMAPCGATPLRMTHSSLAPPYFTDDNNGPSVTRPAGGIIWAWTWPREGERGEPLAHKFALTDRGTVWDYCPECFPDSSNG
jgi:hypothetical protein